MDCTCRVDQRRLVPAVFNLKQYLNSTETMVWTLDSTLTNNGECDLCDYDAFLVLSVGGQIDEIMLAKQMIGDQLKLYWNVGTYATELKDYVKYQIVFKPSTISTLGVLGGNDLNANGRYMIVSDLAEGTSREFYNYSNDYFIKWDKANLRWALFDNEKNIIDYQTFPNIEPCCGTWGTVAVGNMTASVWASDEAIMYISESIAADQAISANFPTILRQLWDKVRQMIIRSGVSVFEAEVNADDWQGSEAPYYVKADEAVVIPTGCKITDIKVLQEQGNGTYSDISNITHTVEADGTVTIYCLDKVAGKIQLTIKGGNDHVFVDREAIGEQTITMTDVEKAIKEQAATKDEIEKLENSIEEIEATLGVVESDIDEALSEVE